MRIVIAFFAAAILLTSTHSMPLFWLTWFGVWVVLQVLSPGKCPYCKSYVKLWAGTCRRCGKAVRE